MKNKLINKYKKGFTLIEIIISIVLIFLVAGSFTVVTINKNNNKIKKTLSDNAPNFELALQVYLENNKNIINNINKNAKGAIVTLEVLKNEGLIKDDLDIDYKKQYYLLSNALLAPAPPTTNCDSEQVSLAVVESWNVDTSNVIYICSNNGDNGEVEALTEDIEVLKEKINSLEAAIANADLGANNWVIFNVNSDPSKAAYWPENGSVYQDHWQIVKTEKTGGNYKYKLLYNTNVLANNELRYSNANSQSLLVSGGYTSDLYSCIKKNSNGTCNKWEQNINKDNVYKLSSNFAIEKDDSFSISEIVVYNNNFYIASSYNRYTESIEPVSKSGISLNKENYYRKQNGSSEFSKYDSIIGWDIPSIINEKTTTSGTKKNILYNQIPNNLRGKIINNNYLYKYTSTTMSGEDFKIIPTETFDDKFGVLSIIDVDNISQYFGRGIFSGIYNFNISFNNYNGIINISNGQISFNVINKKFENNQLYSIEELEYNDKKYSSFNTYYVDGKKYYTAPYTPVITIGNANLVTNIDEYKSQMSTEYQSCTNSDFGKKDCPYLIKFSDGTYSNAT